ncbi:MAG TPA: hypothetical protein VME67_03875 [Mycobacterium sp.]|nr:hypothetical protein [Mycobacterium sp.]HTX94042.1 hypothetical protein [Mycobacterium sp.]
MSDISIGAPRDAIAQPTAAKDAVSPPVLITEQQVMLGTAAAVPPPSTLARRMIDALRVVRAAVQLPPPRPIYTRAAYLEGARMEREMHRL